VAAAAAVEGIEEAHRRPENTLVGHPGVRDRVAAVERRQPDRGLRERDLRRPRPPLPPLRLPAPRPDRTAGGSRPPDVLGAAPAATPGLRCAARGHMLNPRF
jgi:hypothetical protein